MEKGVKNCAYCVDYSYEKLAKFLEQAPEAKKTLGEIRQNYTSEHTLFLVLVIDDK